MPPFERSEVKPIVADLLKVRAWIAEHGFTCSIGRPGGARCFVYAANDALSNCVRAYPLYEIFEAELSAQFGEPRPGDNDYNDAFAAQFFSVPYLARNVGTTERALEIIDAAIARES